MLQEAYDLIEPAQKLLDQLQNDLLPLSLSIDGYPLKDQTLLHIYMDDLSDKFEEAKKVCDKIKEFAAFNINHTMTKEELDKATLHGFNWYPKLKSNFNCTKEKSEEFLAWCKKNAPDLIKETVHPKTLEAYCNGLLEGGKEIPPMLSRFDKDTVLRRKD